MATDLGLLSLTQLQKLAQSKHQNQTTQNRNVLATGSWMWSPKMQSGSAQTIAQDDDDSWEVRAFEEDTNQAMGTTWPPRSYTCTFCMREFKSAQALGGHMNVHRRDRARLHHQVQPGSKTPSSRGDTNSPTIVFPTQDYMANGGVCILYALPNPNSGGANASTDQPYSHLTMSRYQPNNLEPHYPASIDFSVLSRSSINSSQSHSSDTEPSASASVGYSNFQVINGSPIEELDLELRLGRNSSRS